jgi:membrane fusion protein, multidrug efflux system
MRTFFIAIISTIALTLLSCKKDEATKPVKSNSSIATDAVAIKTTTLGSGSETSAIQSIGAILSDAEAKPSFKTGGVINKTFFKEGDNVKKGQLMATLVMSEINAQVQQAEEGLAKAERDAKRISNLYADSVATQEQYQNVNTALQIAKRTVEIAKFNKQYSEVRSPISGKIIKQIMHDGEIVGPGMPIYAIMGIQKSDWKIRASLVDREWALIKNGDKAEVVLDAYPGKTFEAFVTDKSTIGGQASSTIDVELTFRNAPINMAAGMIAKVKFNKSQGVKYNTLPIESITEATGSTGYIYLIKNGIASKTKITTGKMIEANIEVLSPLPAGCEVATLGAVYLEDGDKVKVIK